MDLFLFGVIVVLGIPIAAIAGLIIAQSARNQLRLVTERVATLEGEMRALRLRLGEAPAAPQQRPETLPQETPATQSQAVPEISPEVAQQATAGTVSPQPQVETPGVPMLPPAAARGDDGWERQLSERWMVWLGGVTLALGGAFLVKFSIDQGLLGPTVRVILGCLLGIAIMALGHWLSYRQGGLPVAGVDPSYVPPALVGAGATMIFASLFAAYGLYDLLSPVVAFAGLAVVAASAALMSLRHGPFVAALGLVGALVVPALVPSEEPSAFGLFAYLLLVTAPMMALLRWRGWWWLAWIQLAGALIWVALWLADPYKPGDEWIVGSFLLLTFGIFVALRRGISSVSALAGVIQLPEIRNVVAVAATAVAVGLFLVTLVAGYSTTSLIFVLAFSLAALAFAYRDQAFDFVPLIAAGLVAAVLAAWQLPALVWDQGDWVRPAVPEGAAACASWATCFAALFGVAGFVVCRRAERPGRWAALSAGAPVVITAIVYWRLSNAGIELAWVAVAIILAALLLAAAHQVARLRANPGMEAALGVYAVGVIAALALAATMGLKEAWLTVALSLILPGAGWVDARIGVPGLRRTALVVAAVVLVRLVFNPYLLDYTIENDDAFNWLLYGYGVPAIAFAVAAYLFRRARTDLTTQTLEAGAILFTVMLVSLEIHHVVAGGLSVAAYGLTERSLHTIAWLFLAAALSVSSLRDHEVVRWACRILLAISAFQAVLLQALIGNPYFTREPVGDTPIFNLLLFAFALPAVFFALHAYMAKEIWLRRGCGLLSLALGLLWLTLEVRHSFTGSVLSGTHVASAELYSYSLAWLIVNGLVLASGFIFGSAELRRWGLILLIVVVLKVFIIDMSSLDGIWRAFSFLGLGAALVAVGWFYRRYIGNLDQTARPTNVS